MSQDPLRSRYTVVKELFLDALDQPEESRLTWLRKKSGRDGALYQEVEQLLISHDEAEQKGLFERPLVARPSNETAASREGQHVGVWTLQEKIGSGGMGSVYRAVRSDGAFERTVAIKLIRSDLTNEYATEKFDLERNALARLDHPNIARLYDGGQSDIGPYLVMEFVDGIPITEYCEANDLIVRERIELFIQACNAVGYAHRNLVVHRDIKPSNILVNESGSVKLLDFGISRLLDDEDRQFVSKSSSAMTPAYAAPEQVLDHTITTVTDVYSLGVLLYELVTGSRPYSLTDLSVSEIEKTVCHFEPPRPSSLDGIDSPDGTVSTDLDLIILKALAKEGDQRYSSPQSLSSDLQRLYSGEMIEARTPTRSYRMASFIRRNRAGVFVTATILCALLAGLSIAVWQAKIASRERDLAETRFELAREVTSTLLFDIHDSIANLSGSTPAREMIVNRSLSYLQELDKTATGDAQLVIDIAGAYRRIGDVLGNPSNNNLGKVTEAIASYERGLDVLSRVRKVDSLSLSATLTEALLFEKLADAKAHIGQIDSALLYLDTSVQLFEKGLTLEPLNVDRVLAVAIGNIKRGDYTGNRHFPNAGDPAAARSYYENSLELLKHADTLDVDNSKVQRYFGLIHERFGTIHEQQNLQDEAVSSFQKSLAYREKLWEANPNDMVLYRDAGIAHEKVGLMLQEENRLDEALHELRTAHAYYSDLAASDPTNMNASITLAVSELQMGYLMYSDRVPHFDDRNSARAHFSRALVLLDSANKIDSSNVRIQNLLDETRNAIAALTS